MEFNGKWGLVMILGLGYLYIWGHIAKRPGNAMNQQERWENQWHENQGDMVFHAHIHGKFQIFPLILGGALRLGLSASR